MESAVHFFPGNLKPQTIDTSASQEQLPASATMPRRRCSVMRASRVTRALRMRRDARGAHFSRNAFRPAVCV